MYRKLFLIASLPLILASCSNGVKETLGMKKPAPDEFLVISNPPLSVPPSFELVSPGAEPLVQQSNAEQPQSDSLDQTDKALLQALGSNNVSGNGKAAVDRDHYEMQRDKQSKGAIRSTIGKLQGDGNQVIDPVAERARIKANAEAGKPINEGEVKNKSESTLNRLFN